MKEIIIGENDAGQRLDRFLQKAYPDLPQSLRYKYLRLGRIKVDGKKAKGDRRLSAGEQVRLYIGEEFLGGGEQPPFLAASCWPEILYEDANLLILNKPAGLLSHEDSREKRDTLINRALRYLPDTGQYQPDREQSFTPALCNRIDRNTQGIVTAAKNAAALREMERLFRERRLQKRYLCAVEGRMEREQETLRGWHTKDPEKNLVKITPYPREGAKTAVTEYRTLCERNGLSLLEVLLHTGRTHQIRAHLAAAGHPICGDAKYGNAKSGSKQALCSYSLRFCVLPDDNVLRAVSGKEFRLRDVDFAARLFPDFRLSNI